MKEKFQMDEQKEFWRRVFSVTYSIRILTVRPFRQTSYRRREAGLYKWQVVEETPYKEIVVAEGEVRRKRSAEARATAKLREIMGR